VIHSEWTLKKIIDSTHTLHTMPQRKESTGPQLCVTLYIMQVEFEVSNIEINASSL
jgi:hypothetical protein